MPQTIDPTLIETIRQRLAHGKRVRRLLPGHGRLHFDRPLPFLVVYRRPIDHPDPGTDRLVRAESSYLIASAEDGMQSSLSELVRVVVETMAERFNAFLLLEIWCGKETHGEGRAPVFCIRTPPNEDARPTIAALVRGLRSISPLWTRPQVRVKRGGHAPPGMPALLTLEQAKRNGCLMLGLEVPPVYRDALGSLVFPEMLRELHRGLSRALQKSFFAFTRVQTRATVEHYQALGRRAVVEAVWQVDRQLAEIDDAFDFILAVTPLNTREAFLAFKASHFRADPVFHYRLLSIDPDLLKRRLHAIPVEKVEDPALGELFREKRTELDRQLTMLQDRQTRRFFYGSMQLYDGVDDDLLNVATRTLARLARSLPVSRKRSQAARVDAPSFAQRAREEIDAYRRVDSLMQAKVQIRGDIPGLLVSDETLLIGQDLHIPASRVEALIAHEVGTHLLSYFNGRAQRLQLLRCGLPGCEELQEGIAVLSEWLTGGLSRSRLRVLAARVLAVQRLADGASFVEIYHELREHGFRSGAAFNIAMRIFRSGGFTKDAIYLRGLMRLLQHLREGNELDELLVGKISLASLPLVRELQWRGLLRPALLRPRYLEHEAALRKLRRLRKGLSVTDLTDGDTA